MTDSPDWPVDDPQDDDHEDLSPELLAFAARIADGDPVDEERWLRLCQQEKSSTAKTPSGSVGESQAQDAESYTGESTVELLELMRGGDSDAMDRLVRRYLPLLKRWAHGRLPSSVRDLVEVDDLVEEALLRTLRQLPNFEGRFSSAFDAYVYRGVKNRIQDEIRRRHREPLRQHLREETVSSLIGEELSPLKEAIGQELQMHYEEALKTLRPRDQEAIVARLELRLPYEEIASALGKSSADAARMVVVRAMARLVQAIHRLQGPVEGQDGVDSSGSNEPES
ncbi:MAG: sigma-70 family RNA polymerase sigma factor [Acidobacteriota bacterium]